MPRILCSKLMIVSETQLIFTLIYRIPTEPDDTSGNSFKLELLAAVRAMSLLSLQTIPRAFVVVSEY